MDNSIDSELRYVLSRLTTGTLRLLGGIGFCTRTHKCVANQSIEVYVVNWMYECKSMALYPSVGSRWKEASVTSELLADFLFEIHPLAAFTASFGWVRKGARKCWPPVHISTKQSTVQ